MCPAAADPSRTYQGWTKLSGMDRKMLIDMPHVEYNTNGPDLLRYLGSRGNIVLNMCPAAAAPIRTYQGWTKLSGVGCNMVEDMPNVK